MSESGEAQSRASPRWLAATVCYVIASLAAGITLAGVEYFGDFLNGTPSLKALTNFAASSILYGGLAGLNCAPLAVLAGLLFWWFRVDGIGAYVVAAVAIAGLLILAGLNLGFDEIGALPGALVGGLVMWACMRLSVPKT